MKSRSTCRDRSVAILPNLNLVLNRRLHVVRVMASVSNIPRAVQDATILIDKPEVLRSDSFKRRGVLSLYRSCPLVFDC